MIFAKSKPTYHIGRKIGITNGINRIGDLGDVGFDKSFVAVLYGVKTFGTSMSQVMRYALGVHP